MKTQWILTTLFVVACSLGATGNLIAQEDGNSGNVNPEGVDDGMGDDEESVSPINLKFSTRRVTTKNKSLINIVMDASGSMREPMIDPATGDTHERGEYVRAAVQGFVAELKPDITAAGLVLFGHRAYWVKKKRTQEAGSEEEDPGTNSDNPDNKTAAADGMVPVVWQEILPTPEPNFSAGTSTDYHYTPDGAIRQSILGEEQFPDDPEAINPSFDVQQEIEVLAVDDAQRGDLNSLVDRVRFESGAPTPLHQAVLEAVLQLKAVESDAENRDVVVVTDEFNHLADEQSRMQDVRLSDIREELVSGEVRIHWVLFGPEFQPKAGYEELGPYELQQLARMKSLAEDFGGSLRIARTPKELALAMIPLVDPATKPRLGIVKGKLLRNGHLVGIRSDFTVELIGGDGEPIPAPGGEFEFDKVEIGKEYSLVVKGRIRNTTYEKLVEKIAAAPRAKAKDVRIEFE